MTSPGVEARTSDLVTGVTSRSALAERLLANVLRGVPGILEGPSETYRRAVLEVALTGLTAADPGAATRRCLTYDADTDVLTVVGRRYELRRAGRILVVGAGKASYPVAVALEDILQSRIATGVVAVRDPDAPPLPHIQVVCADHPLPTERSIRAAERILECAADAGPDDVVITCFTGGSSALSSLPAEGVRAEDKRTLHQQLLSSGLAITQINAVRKQVSAVKGGRVALAAMPARVINLTVSDVAGSPLDSITDPTVQDTSDAATARAVLHQAQLWSLVPSSVREHLERDLPTPQLTVEPQTVMLADGASTVAAMKTAATALGYHPVVEDELEGDAAEVAEHVATRALDESEARGAPVMVLGCGGESVVSLDADGVFGQGGPNQDAALRAAEVLAGHRAAALFIDTDGSDGGTPFAGGLVDGETAQRATEHGVDLEQLRRQHRSTAACELLRLGVRMGHTGTNVNDLFVVLAVPEVTP